MSVNKKYKFVESPNRWENRNGKKPEAIVIHITQGSYKSALAWMTNKKSQVSAHFLIDEKGGITQLVEIQKTAWHAGVIKNPVWPKLKTGVNPNLYTIGIELAGFAEKEPLMEQIVSAAKLVKEICTEYKIPINGEGVVPHRNIHAGKICPGYKINTDVIIYLARLPLDKI